MTSLRLDAAITSTFLNHYADIIDQAISNVASKHPEDLL